MDQPSVFLCHAHEDKPFVRLLASALSQYGVSVWVDECELRIGDSVVERIADAIMEGDFLLAVISPASRRSHWCKQELSWAATRGIEDKRVVVLPIKYKNAEMPPSLKDRHWADADETDLASLAERIVRDIDRHRGIEPSSSDRSWLNSVLNVYATESPAAQERWRFHLEAAARAGKASVRVDGSTHHTVADRLARLGALTPIRTSGSWVFFEMTERGRALLASLSSERMDQGFETVP